MSNNKAQQLQIDIQQDVAKGVYSNFAIISHSHAEFIVDLASTLPGTPKAQVVSRVILAPEHAKRLAMALQENIMRQDTDGTATTGTDRRSFRHCHSVRRRGSVIQFTPSKSPQGETSSHRRVRVGA